MSDDFFNPGNTQVPIGGLFARNPLRFRSKVITNRQMVDRTRRFMVPLGSGTVFSGTPTYAARGVANGYPAWSFASGADNYITVQAILPSDYTKLGGGATTVTTFTPYLRFTNLTGSPVANVIWDLSIWITTAASPDGIVISSLFSSSAVSAVAHNGAQLKMTAQAFQNGADGSTSMTTLSIRIGRNGLNASDTFTGAAGLYALWFEYNADM